MFSNDQSNPKIQRSVWSSLLFVVCILGFCLLLIASLIVLSLIPVYLNNRNVESASSSNNAPTFNATYRVLSGDVGSLRSTQSIDQARTARSFAQGLSLSELDSLQIQGISEDTIDASTRRKRLIHCDRGSTNVNGTGLIFQFNLNYPPRLSCQTNNCKNKKYTQIYQRFGVVSELAIELAGATVQLQLCSLGVLFITGIGSTGTGSGSAGTGSGSTGTGSGSAGTGSGSAGTGSGSAGTGSGSTGTGSGSNVTHDIWQFATNMSAARYQPSTTLTDEGNSVVISGSSSIYDFPSASLSPVDTLTENGSLISSKNISYMRNFHTTNHLPSSNVILFAGGINAPDGTKLNNAELFNPTTGTATVMNMSSIRFDHQSAVANSSNKIVLIGGTDENGTVSSSGDVFDGNKFTSILNQMTYGRRYHTVTYLPTINKILIAGGETTINCAPKILDTVELYNIDTNMFESSGNITMSSPRSLHTATYIPSPYNQVLILGGSGNGTSTLNTYEIFDVSSLSFIKNGTIQSARAAHTATFLGDNINILIVGGYSSNEEIDVSYQPIAPCEIFNMTTMSTAIVANMNVPRAFHTAVLLPDTSDVLCCGGVDANNTALASCERYLP